MKLGVSPRVVLGGGSFAAEVENGCVLGPHVANIDGQVAHLGAGLAVPREVVAGEHAANGDADVADLGVGRGGEIESGH